MHGRACAAERLPAPTAAAKATAVARLQLPRLLLCCAPRQIMSGDAIQAAGGAALGLSTMAAAGFGNMASAAAPDVERT